MGSSTSKEVGELFQKHGAMVYRRAFRLLGRKEDAEEATQEVFIRAMRGLGDFDQRCSVTTWLYQITTNYCLDQLRNSSRRRRLFAVNVQPEEGASKPAAGDLVFIRQLLCEADPEQARAVVYVYLDGMSHEQAAEVLGVAKRTVGNQIDRFLAWAQKRSGHQEKTALPEPSGVAVKEGKRN